MLAPWQALWLETMMFFPFWTAGLLYRQVPWGASSSRSNHPTSSSGGRRLVWLSLPRRHSGHLRQQFLRTSARKSWCSPLQGILRSRARLASGAPASHRSRRTGSYQLSHGRPLPARPMSGRTLVAVSRHNTYQKLLSDNIVLEGIISHYIYQDFLIQPTTNL